MSKLLAVISILLMSLNPWPALAHGPGEHEEKTGLAALLDDSPSLKKLEALLHENLEKTLAAGGAQLPDAEAGKMGKLLVEGVEDEWKELLKDYKPESAARKGFDWVKGEALEHLNLVKTGKSILEAARTRGPGLAIAMGVSELTENTLIVFGTTHPHFSFLIPIAASHGVDAVTYGLAVGAPNAYRHFKLWGRHGGVLTGALNYYHFLVDQRKTLPIDWEVTKHVVSASPELKLVVLKEGIFDRVLPESIKVITNPNQIAQMKTSPYVTLKELETLAKKAKLDFHDVAKFKSNPAAYSELLTSRILANPEASVRFGELAVARNSPHPEFWKSFGRDMELDDLLAKASSQDLRATGETPDILARRYLWHFRHGRDELLEEMQGKRAPKSAYEAARKLRKTLDTDQGLWRIANTRYPAPTPEDYGRLLAEVKGVQENLAAMRTGISGSAGAVPCLIEPLQRVLGAKK